MCVGFGISSPQTVEAVCSAADGAIVGSALVRVLTDHKADPPAKLAGRVGELVAQLLEPIK